MLLSSKTLPISVSQELGSLLWTSTSGQVIGYFIARSQKGAADDGKLFMIFITLYYFCAVQKQVTVYKTCQIQILNTS